MFRVDVLSIFSHSLKLFHLLMNDYVRRHAIQRQDIIASLERVLPVLLQRTGDSNARLRLRAQEAIIESASYRELKPLQVIPHHCVYPFPKTCAPRLAISRCELIEELMKVLDVKKGDQGLNVDNVSKFCAQAVEHNGSSLPSEKNIRDLTLLLFLAGEVRELAIKILLSLYKVSQIDGDRYPLSVRADAWNSCQTISSGGQRSNTSNQEVSRHLRCIRSHGRTVWQKC